MIADPNRKTTRPSHVACKHIIQNSLTRYTMVRPRSPRLKHAVSAYADIIHNPQGSIAQMHRCRKHYPCADPASLQIQSQYITRTWWLKNSYVDLGKPCVCWTCVTRFVCSRNRESSSFSENQHSWLWASES